MEFYSADDAAEAHDKLDHAKLAGREIAIVFAKDKRKTPGEMRGGRDVGPRGMYQLRVLISPSTDRTLTLRIQLIYLTFILNRWWRET